MQQPFINPSVGEAIGSAAKILTNLASTDRQIQNAIAWSLYAIAKGLADKS